MATPDMLSDTSTMINCDGKDQIDARTFTRILNALAVHEHLCQNKHAELKAKQITGRAFDRCIANLNSSTINKVILAMDLRTAPHIETSISIAEINHELLSKYASRHSTNIVQRISKKLLEKSKVTFDCDDPS